MSDSVEPQKKRPGRGERRPVAGSSADPVILAATPMPKKNPIHSLVTTLPVIMLLAGLGIYFSNERKQFAGEPILSEAVQYSGRFSGISKQNDKINAQRILWVQSAERLRGARIDYAQYNRLSVLDDQAQVNLWAAPRVAGSATLWVVRLTVDGSVVLGGATQLPPADKATTDRQ